MQFFLVIIWKKVSLVVPNDVKVIWMVCRLHFLLSLRRKVRLSAKDVKGWGAFYYGQLFIVVGKMDFGIVRIGCIHAENGLPLLFRRNMKVQIL
jgi:hypothetical protein